MLIDPRYYQISILSFLLFYGLLFLDFEIHFDIAITILLTAQLTQYFCTEIFLKQHSSLYKFDPRSALISSLSLCLLLRTEVLLIAALAAFIAIGSKFVIRSKNKHIFNPTNFALVVMILCFDSAWVSSGQWGRDLIFLFLIACLGMLVINKSRRSDITIAFLIFYTTIVFGRAVWLGDPLTIPLHQLQSGALLIFAFFMISDPMTTPNSRLGRIIFAAFVTLVASYIQFVLYQPNGVLYALVGCCLLTPLIDHFLPDEKFQWQISTARYLSKPVQSKGIHYEKTNTVT
ncbi:MAG: RnfABCDGE type electron transport complex subunit D [Gammaproteobacteria bacterium]